MCVGLWKRWLIAVSALALGLGGGGLWLASMATPSGAVTVFNVTDVGDSGPNTLRQAITAASVSGGSVVVQPGLGTISLSTGVIAPPTWGGAVTIQGNGVTVDGGGSTTGVIKRGTGSTGDLSIDGMTITNSAPFGVTVAAVIAEGTGALHLSNCVISHNHASGDGGAGAGAVYTDTADATSIAGCVIGPDNTATSFSAAAGGVTNEGGPLTIANSSIIGNSSSAQNDSGGGVFNNGVSVTVVNSSITGNTATGTVVIAGAIDNEGGPATTTNSTISGNSATNVSATVAGATATAIPPRRSGSGGASASAFTPFIAGGVANLGGVETLTYVTLDNNSNGAAGVSQFVAGNYLNAGGTVTFFATAIGGSAGAASCATDNTTFVSAGYNAEDDAAASCGFSTSTNDLVGQALGLGALGNNGGPGPTLLPQTGSPLIDHVPAASCQAGSAAGITTDERGITRPQGPGCDTGAVEVEVIVPVVIQPTFTG